MCVLTIDCDDDHCLSSRFMSTQMAMKSNWCTEHSVAFRARDAADISFLAFLLSSADDLRLITKVLEPADTEERHTGLSKALFSQELQSILKAYITLVAIDYLSVITFLIYTRHFTI